MLDVTKATLLLEEARKVLREAKLPNYKRVQVGDAYRSNAIANIDNALDDIKLLSEALRG